LAPHKELRSIERSLDHLGPLKERALQSPGVRTPFALSVVALLALVGLVFVAWLLAVSPLPQ
jgi:hypothetical protein